jgi:hypothetical protein
MIMTGEDLVSHNQRNSVSEHKIDSTLLFLQYMVLFLRLLLLLLALSLSLSARASRPGRFSMISHTSRGFAIESWHFYSCASLR